MEKEKIRFFEIRLFLICFLLFISGQNAGSQSLYKILLSNDDGVQAPGIAALFEKLSPVGQVTVAAPNRNFSGAGHGITSQDPIMVEMTEKKGRKWYAIGALPATCVRLALEALVTNKPDIVISGINRGENIGLATYYSATVACAREATFKGIPSVAVSFESGQVMDYEPTARFIAELVKEIKEKGLKSNIFLNINFPNLPQTQIRGVKITRLDKRPSLEYFERRVNPKGKTYFWPLYKPLDAGAEKTDTWALRNGYISITPLQLDQTSYPDLQSFESWKVVLWKK